MTTDVSVDEELATLNELERWFQQEGMKIGYGTKLFSVPKWRNAAQKIALRDGINEYEEFRRWYIEQPIRF